VRWHRKGFAAYWRWKSRSLGGHGAFTYVTKNRVTLSFNSAGNLATWSNPAGVIITLNYSGTPVCAENLVRLIW